MAFVMASLLFSVLLLTCFSFLDASYVPVLFLGSDSDHVPDDPTSAVHKLTDSEYREDYLRTLLDKGPVVLLAQDSLSLEDFSMLGNAYGSRPNKKTSPFANLEKRLDTMASLLLPSVNMQPTTLTSADNPKWNVVDVKDSEKSLKDNGIQLTANNLIVIHLPATKKATADRAESLKTSDEVLEKFAKELEDAGVKYTLIYTASQPSWTVDQEDTSRISRNLLSTAEETVGGGCVIKDDSNNTLLYLTSVMALNLTDGVSTVVQTINCTQFSLSSSFLATEYTASLTRTEHHPFKIDFTFKEDRGFWLLLYMSFTSKLVNMTVDDASLAVSGIWAPIGFSYTCQDSPFYQNITNATKLGVRLENFQLQPFNANKTVKFGDPMDCVGFFTIPIWMSIFVTILLLAILGFGVQMVMSINTMDRFDDPKGKTITVSNVD